MARMTFNIQVECEVVTLEEALVVAEGEDEIAYIKQYAHCYPMPVVIHKVTCEGQPVKDEEEDYMEHRYLIAGTGGDGYTLSVTHYIV